MSVASPSRGQSGAGRGTGSLGNQASCNRRSIHTNPATQHAGQELEIQFLQYRLEVVQCWPESVHKQTTLEAIVQRLAIVAPTQDLS